MSGYESLKSFPSADKDVRYELVEFANPSTEGIPLFEYDRLQGMKKRIRLLRLLAGPPENLHVECELFEGEFSKDGQLIEPRSLKTNGDEPKADSNSRSNVFLGNKEAAENSSPNKIIRYEALSWRWGAESSHQILIRKGTELTRKPAHQQLVWALKYLRKVKEDRILWIDAICIDQSNTVERNHQVEMMARIYSIADGVCVWLGIDDRESRLAIKFIKDEVMKLQQFDELCEKEENSEKWQSLLNLMQRSWFNRRWVVQEIALAKKAKIYCGPDEIDWDQFAVAVELFVEVETATHRLSEVMKKDRKYYHVPGWFEYVSELGASLLVQATGTIFRDDKRAKKGTKKDQTPSMTKSNTPDMRANGLKSTDTEPQGFERRPLLSLEHLVSTLSAFDVSEPRDAIYALLAIANDTSPLAAPEDNGSTMAVDQTQEVLETFTVRKIYAVDYDKPYEDVCKDFITFCVNRSCKDDVATTRALDIICRPWAPVLVPGKSKTTGKEEVTFMVLPSWIPQLSRASFGMIATPGISSQKMDRKNADTLVGYPLAGQRNYNATQTWGIDKSTLKWRKRLSEDFLNGNHPVVPRVRDDLNKEKRIETSQQPGESQGSVTTRRSKENDGKSKSGRFSGPLWSIISNKRKPLDRSIGSHYSMYVKGFVLDTIEKTTEASQNGAIPKEWIELAGWENPLEGNTDAPEEFWRTLVADRGKDGRNPPVYYAKACKESVSKGGLLTGAVNTTSLIHNERNSIVAQFCRRVQAVIWNRSLIETESNRLGLVAKGVRKGDKVCILYGCSVPVILRRCEKPKTAEQIAEEERYDIQELFLSALEAGKQLRQKLQERKKKYEKRDDEDKEGIKTHTKEVNEKLMLEKDESLKRAMNDWLELQKRKEVIERLKMHHERDFPTVRRDRKTEDRAHEMIVDQWVAEHKSWQGSETRPMNQDLPKDHDAPRKKRKRQRTEDDNNAGALHVTNDIEKQGAKKKRKRKEKKPRKAEKLEATYEKRTKDHNLMGEDEEKKQNHDTTKPIDHSNSDDDSPLDEGSPSRIGAEKSRDTEKSSKIDGAIKQLLEIMEASSNDELTENIRGMVTRKIQEEMGKDLTEPHEDKKWHYKFLGECYIHGMMDGEAIREFTEQGLSDQVFELR